MTKTLKFALLGLPLSLLLGAGLPDQPSAPRIATIDMQKVSDKYYKWQEAKQALAKEQADLKKEVDQDQAGIAKSSDEYKKLRQQVDDPMITPDERRSREKQAQDKEDQIQNDTASLRQLVNEGQQKLQRDYQNLVQLIYEDIQTAIKAKAHTAGYTMVLKVSTDALQSDSPVLYSNGDNDITDEIIKQLNAGAPAFGTATGTNSSAASGAP